jgi:hypothetical protein
MKKKNEFIQLYRRSIRISSEKIQRYYFRRDEVERKKIKNIINLRPVSSTVFFS